MLILISTLSKSLNILSLDGIVVLLKVALDDFDDAWYGRTVLQRVE